MKSTVSYNSGLMLTIPKQGLSCLLFLEWLSTKPAAVNIVHKVIDKQDDVLKIRLNCTKEDYLNCSEYINNNL